MIERWKAFQRKSPFAAGIFAGAVAALVLIFLAAVFFGAKGEFGSAKTILKEDYLRLSIGEFGQSGDADRARWRYERFGPEGSAYLYLMRNDPLTDPALLLNFARSVGDDVFIAGETEALKTPARSGFPFFGIVFVLLLAILAVGGGYLFLTDPKNRTLVSALRARIDPILARFGPFLKKKAPGNTGTSAAEEPKSEPTIHYRQPSFELRDYEPGKTENASSAAPPFASVPAESSEESIFDVFEQPTGPDDETEAEADRHVPQSPAAGFFAEVKSEPKAEPDPDAAADAFTDRDLPGFLSGTRTPPLQDRPESESEPVQDSKLSEPDDAGIIRPDAAVGMTAAPARAENAGRAAYAFYEPPRPGGADDEGRAPDSSAPTEFSDGPSSAQDADGDSAFAGPNPDAADDAIASAEAGDGVEPPPWDEPDSSAGAEPETEPDLAAEAEPEAEPRRTFADRIEPFQAESIYDTAAAFSDKGGVEEADHPASASDSEPPSEESDADSAPAGTSVRFSVEPPRVRNLSYRDDNLPLVHYKAIYQLGDDLFDETFSIDDYDDEFIGECGIGIAETINTTEPKAVTAFEAWLFDRQDTTTPTFFMLSDYAYRQPEMLERLKNKGRYDVMKVGQSYIIETFALKMTLTILEIVYGTESSDSKSYFDRVVFDVEVVRRGS